MPPPGAGRGAAAGTSEDLFSIVIRADESRIARDRWSNPPKNEFVRRWAEAPLNLAARALSLGAGALPSDWMCRLQDAVLQRFSHPHSRPFDRSERLDRAVGLVRRVEDGAGGPAALLAIISHPPLRDRLKYMNFELVRHATWVLRQLRGRPCRPRFVVAVDSYALDSVGVAEEALYAGFMGHYHLGLDRMALARPFLSGLALAETSRHRFPRRFVASLLAAGEVGLALAGGVDTTTRVWYAVPEWLAACRRRSPLAGRPAEVLGLLRGMEAYRAFEAGSPQWARQRSVWRRMDAWLMSAMEEPALAGRGEPSCAETGALAPPADGVARLCLEALGWAEPDRARAVEELADVVSRETPYRARFFRLVCGRVLKRGRPVVLVPVVHHVGDNVRIEVGTAWAWKRLSSGAVEATSALGMDWRGSAEDFALRFVRDEFR
ncbi:MAG: hypothetical protein HY927_10490 [Elusimicrobia bacterium]|nr:hypothetical protein [Elusimicrobiota bacterium]